MSQDRPKNPWMKWFPSDWRADPAVRACEPITRYVWFEMLGLMHEAEPRGYLVLNGVPIGPEVLSRLIDVPLKTVNAALKQLRQMAVFSETDDGIIVSRRILRDELRATSARLNGKAGGNPALKNQTLNSRSVKGLDKGEDKTHIPEARGQKLEKEPTVLSERATHTRNEPAKKLSKEKRPDTYWPEELRLTVELREYAESRGVRKVSEVWEAFENHHRAKGSKFRDWVAAWRKWVGNEVKFAPEERAGFVGHLNGGGRAPAPRLPSKQESALAGIFDFSGEEHDEHR